MVRTTFPRGPKGYILESRENEEVHRCLESARKAAATDVCDYILYEDEPRSYAYCRACYFGSYSWQSDDKIIARIEVTVR